MEKTIKKSKYNIHDKWFWVKISGFLIFITTIIIDIITFVGEEWTPFYGDAVSHGFGLIMAVVSWGFWFSSIETKAKTFWVKSILSIISMTISISLMPSIGVIVTSALSLVIIVIVLVYKILHPNDLPNTL